MEFWPLLIVASKPVLQVLLVCLLGAFLASGYINILTASARTDINKIVFVVFVPALVFASLAQTVTAKDIVSWWFMPVNVGITFLAGGLLGWAAIKILRPADRQLQALVIACCSAGNLGALPLIIVPALCDEGGSPFGSAEVCRSRGVSYVSFSMALGNLFIWTHTYNLLKKSVTPQGDEQEEALLLPSSDPSSSAAWENLKGITCSIAKELLAPPTTASILGFAVGALPWLNALIAEEASPLRLVQDCMVLLGDGAIPCTIIILGGNLTQAGLRKSTVRPRLVAAVVCVRYVMLPLLGIAVVTGAGRLGFLPRSPLFRYVLLVQFTVPPAMSIGTMAQLFGACQEECSVIFLWTYLVAALALTAWSVVFMWIIQ